LDSVVLFGLQKLKKRKSSTTYWLSLEENDDFSTADKKILRIEKEVKGIDNIKSVQGSKFEINCEAKAKRMHKVFLRSEAKRISQSGSLSLFYAIK